MDMRVKIRIPRTADMRGKRGVVVDFHAAPHDMPKDRRYTVELDGGGICKIKPTDVRVEPRSATAVVVHRDVVHSAGRVRVCQAEDHETRDAKVDTKKQEEIVGGPR